MQFGIRGNKTLKRYRIIGTSTGSIFVGKLQTINVICALYTKPAKVFIIRQILVKIALNVAKLSKFVQMKPIT